MAQRYDHPVARERMRYGLCPECGNPPDVHETVLEFWLRRSGCDLLPIGVRERIAQYQADQAIADG